MQREHSTTTAATLHVGVLAGVLAAGAYLYYRWLNLPITVHIPEPVSTPSPGFDALVGAVELLVEVDSLDAALATRAADGAVSWSVEQKEAFLAANAPALNAARAALRLDYTSPMQADGTTYHPALAKFRDLARLFALDSQVKAARGEHGGAVDARIDAVELGVKIPRGGAHIAEIVGYACETIGTFAIWQQIENLDAEGAFAASVRLAQVMRQRCPFADTLRVEKRSGQAHYIEEFRNASTFAALNKMLNSFGLPAAESDQNTTPKPRNLLRAWGAAFRVCGLLRSCGSLLLHSKRRIFADYTAMMDAFIQQAEKPFAARGSDVRIPKDVFNELNGSLIQHARFRNLQREMNGDLLLCAVALQAYHQRHGHYPDTLTELIDLGVLTSLPDDPFAPTAGTPFRYKRISDAAYLLYSVGPDGIDDGGTAIDLASKPDSWRRWLEPTDKGDYVVGVDVGRRDHQGS